MKFKAKNRSEFRLSVEEYLLLTSSSFEYSLDWLPQTDDGYVSGEDPGVIPASRKDDHGKLSRGRVKKLLQLIDQILADSKVTDSDMRLRLQEFVEWLRGAKGVRLMKE